MQFSSADFLDHIWAREQPNTHEQALLKRAQKYCKKISWVPGVKMIAVCNSLSFYAAHENSDIDLFIVTAPRRIWLVRMLCTLQLSLMWVRRRNLNRIKQAKQNLRKDVAGQFCLSFFCTTDALDLSDIAIEDDVYLHFWMRYIKPIVDYDKTYSAFLHANEFSLDETPKDVVKYRVVNSSSPRWHRWNIWNTLNNFFRRLLLPRATRAYTRLGKPSGVVISDDMLKFHDQDKREEYKNNLIQSHG